MSPIDIMTLKRLATEDRELRYKLRGFDGVARVELPDGPVDLVIGPDGVTEVRAGGDGPADVTLRAPAEFWEGALVAVPAPGFESATAGMMSGFEIVGDKTRDVAPYLGAWGRVLTLLRDAAVGHATEVPPQDDPFPDTDTAVGRYVRYAVEGIEYRVYYEEAGSGDVPVLFMHTAGADGREYRHVLADPELQERYRLIAIDLPYHGRSLPPTSVRWWEQDYRPGRDLIMAWIAGFIAALELDRPIFVGCSVGGQLASDLCAHHPDSIRGAIGVNGHHDMAHFEGLFDNDQFRDPRLPNEYYGALNFGVTSPVAPESFRRELYWIYRSNFPGVYAGDNDYFMFEHDLRKDGHLIDTARTPLLMLTGEYDGGARTPEHGAAKVAEAIPGATSEIMEGLGHFAPSDDPVRFRRYLNPALDEIVRRAAAAPVG